MSGPRTILVTGGVGYIGSHTVVDLIDKGYEVSVVDTLERSDVSILKGISAITGKQVDFHQVDCRDEVVLDEIFKSRRFDAVIHFAAYKSVSESVAHPLHYYNNNIGSLLKLLAVMRRNSVRELIFSSSCTVYGQPDQIPVDESAPFKKAESPYGATKQMCERILEDEAVNGLQVVSMRYFNPIGAHPSAQIGELPIGVPSNLCPYVTQTAAGVRNELTIFGSDYNTTDGTCVRDYIDVMDVASGHVDALKFFASGDRGKFEAYNLGTGKGVSVLEFVNTFKRATSVNVPYKLGPRRPGDVEKVFANPDKIRRSFGWKPVRSLEESLVNAWSWEKKLRKSKS